MLSKHQLHKALLVGMVCFITPALGEPNSTHVDSSDQDSSSLGITLEGTYVSKYLWRGYEIFNEHAAFQPSAELDFFGTGFTFNVWHSLPCGRGGGQDLTEVDYTLGYAKSFMEDRPWAVEVSVNYIYYDYPRVNSRAIPDAEEVGGGISLPQLIKIGDSALVPGYYCGRVFTAEEHLDPDTSVEGMYHEFSLNYDLAIPGITPPLQLSWGIGYNDGMYGADHDWSHTVWGIATTIDLEYISITPFIHYQVSMDRSVNDEDELWGGITASVSF